MPKPSVGVERAEVWCDSGGDVFVTLTDPRLKTPSHQFLFAGIAQGSQDAQALLGLLNRPAGPLQRAQDWSNRDGEAFVTLTTFASTLKATSLLCRCLERWRRHSGRSLTCWRPKVGLGGMLRTSGTETTQLTRRTR